MKVGIVHASDRGGGAERSVISLHRGLKKLGHESILYVGRRETDEPGVVEIPYVRGIPGGRRVARTIERWTGWQDIYNPSFRRLKEVFPKDLDLIHFNSLWGSNGFADIGALPGLTAEIPAVITMRENWLLTGHCACSLDCQRWKEGCGNCPDLSRAPSITRDGSSANFRRKRRAVQGANIEIVAISDWLKGRGMESPILEGKSIHRIYNGIDLETFSLCVPNARLEIRKDLGIPPDRVVVLLAGQTVEGFREGIATHHAVAGLNGAEQCGLHALAVGHSAERVAEMLQIPATTVPFAKQPAEMARLFQAADLTLVTSEYEAFGRIAAESQACGIPVVSFDTGGLPEVVAEGVGGLLVPRGDAGGLSRAIDRLAEDQQLRSTLGTGGREFVREHFDQRRIASQYAALYQNVQHAFRGDKTMSN